MASNNYTYGFTLELVKSPDAKGYLVRRYQYYKPINLTRQSNQVCLEVLERTIACAKLCIKPFVASEGAVQSLIKPPKHHLCWRQQIEGTHPNLCSNCWQSGRHRVLTRKKKVCSKKDVIFSCAALNFKKPFIGSLTVLKEHTAISVEYS